MRHCWTCCSVHCNTLQHTATHYNTSLLDVWLQCVAVYCSVLQCAAVCRSVLQFVVMCCSVHKSPGNVWWATVGIRCTCGCSVCHVLQCVAVCCCVPVFCSVYTSPDNFFFQGDSPYHWHVWLQCVAACVSLLQCSQESY